MFLLAQLPDAATLQSFSGRFPEMEIDTTAACLRLLKVASTLLRDLEHHFSRHSLSQARFLALLVLERHPDRQLVPAEIARQMGISKKNTARLLAFMEQDGLVSRCSHETDRRASIVGITERGRGLLDAVLPGYYRVLNGAMRPLGAQDKQTLIGLLDRVGAAVEAAGEGRRRDLPAEAGP